MSGHSNSPLLHNANLYDDGINSDHQLAIEAEMRKIEDYKKRVLNSQPANNNNQPLLWDKINQEILPLSDMQKQKLLNDKDYIANETKIQELVQAEVINLVKGRIEHSPYGRELLERQLALVRGKKEGVIQETNREMELMERFRIASQANPDLTYANFIKSLNSNG